MLDMKFCRKQIQEINMQRKNEQSVAGAKLKQLEER
jgi:Breast carcinoma amplified sequence 2 (BCAS2)